MRTVHRIKMLFYLSAFFLTLMSFTIMLMPRASESAITTNNLSVILVGAFFWVLAIHGYGILGVANHKRKRFWIKRLGWDIQKNYRPGFLCFSANRIAEVFDIMMVIFLISSLVVAFTPWRNTFFFIVLLSLLVWAVNMHSLFNGRIYRITKYKKGEKSYEQR